MAGSTAHAPDQPKKKKKRSGRGENPLAGTAAVASSSAPAPQPSFTSPTKEPKKRKHSTLSTEVIPDNDVGTEADDAAAAAAKKARKKEKKRSKRAKREAEEREAEAQGHALTEAIRRKVEGVEAAGRQQEEQQAKQAKKEKKEKGKGKAPEGEVGSAQREVIPYGNSNLWWRAYLCIDLRRQLRLHRRRSASTPKLTPAHHRPCHPLRSSSRPINPGLSPPTPPHSRASPVAPPF